MVLEVMGTARSMRWLKEDPVPPDMVDRVIWAGTRASSPNNTQGWDFVVVTSVELKRAMKDAIIGARPAVGPTEADEQGPSRQLPVDATERRTRSGSRHLVETLDRVPVIILVCGSNTYPSRAPVIEWAYSAMYAAAQNMLVAARALGLGAAFTTYHQQAQPEIRAMLGVPEDRLIGVTMPLGWPDRAFGPVKRRPLADVVHRDKW